MDLCDICLQKTAQHVLEKVRNDGLAPISLSVYDRNGLPAYYIRMQNSVKLAMPIAVEKAKTAALMGVSTRQIHQRLQNEQLTLADFCGSATTSLVGGVPLTYEGAVIGGVGVSGRKPDQDEEVALFFQEMFAHYLTTS